MGVLYIVFLPFALYGSQYFQLLMGAFLQAAHVFYLRAK